jgi:hypothetical protein
MAPLRVTVIILIFANLLALALWKGWLGGGSSYGEPERLSNQLNPERLRLMTEARPPAAPPAVVKPAPEPEPGRCEGEGRSGTARAPTAWRPRPAWCLPGSARTRPAN